MVRDGRQLAQPNRSRASKRHGLAQGVRISPWHGDFQIDLRRGLPPSLTRPVEAVCKIDRERSACGGMAGQPDIRRSEECWNGVPLPPPNIAYNRHFLAFLAAHIQPPYQPRSAINPRSTLARSCSARAVAAPGLRRHALGTNIVADNQTLGNQQWPGPLRSLWRSASVLRSTATCRPSSDLDPLAAKRARSPPSCSDWRGLWHARPTHGR